MDEYISREAVFQVVHGIARGIATKDTEALKAKDIKTLYKIKGAKEILDSVDTDLCYIPTADVQPVKRGKWFHIDNDGISYCSECNNEAYWDTDYGQQLFDYCPYCGAKMIKDGGKNV